MRTIVAGLVVTMLACSIERVAAQDQALIEAGEQVYEERCASCHGEKLRSAGAIPDLRDLGAGERARFDKAVLEGRGQMPAWEGVLSTQEFEQVWAFVRRYAR